MGRKILLVTADQQRHDALGCNGGKIARTPVIDSLAVAGINYRRAHNQNVVCMPARATIISGQHVRSHGVTMNGVPLPEDTPDIARLLKDQAGYRTALIGKAHGHRLFRLLNKADGNHVPLNDIANGGQQLGHVTALDPVAAAGIKYRF